MLNGHDPTDVCHPLDVAAASNGHMVVTDAQGRSKFILNSRGLLLLMPGDRFLLTDPRNQLLLDSSGCETPDVSAVAGVLQGFRKRGCCGAS